MNGKLIGLLVLILSLIGIVTLWFKMQSEEEKSPPVATGSKVIVTNQIASVNTAPQTKK